MRVVYLGLKFALSYFTVLPIQLSAKDDLSKPKVLAAMLFFFPFVGALLTVVTVLAYLFVLQYLEIFGAVIAAVLYMLLYGFIHTEAISDVSDALYAKHSNKDAYTVIKDPTIGAMGMLYTLALTLIKVALLSYLLWHQLFAAFVVIALVSRFSLLVLIKRLLFRSSFVTVLKEALTNKVFLSSGMSVVIVGVALLQAWFVFYFLAALCIAYLFAKRVSQKLGFANGDLLGASLEFTEVMLFLIAALLAARGC
ncbi:MAG: adenosylcobinamide-GDP ribazoletransferase [Campylobacterota bacterium]